MFSCVLVFSNLLGVFLCTRTPIQPWTADSIGAPRDLPLRPGAEPGLAGAAELEAIRNKRAAAFRSPGVLLRRLSGALGFWGV